MVSAGTKVLEGIPKENRKKKPNKPPTRKKGCGIWMQKEMVIIAGEPGKMYGFGNLIIKTVKVTMK